MPNKMTDPLPVSLVQAGRQPRTKTGKPAPAARPERVTMTARRGAAEAAPNAEAQRRPPSAETRPASINPSKES